ncbi:rlmJ [Symbiodinium pilosum]|uniref:RlmJ protein n=1 Tax=Symbiodinium pilosum TaxID=2952 RepID=A0A812VY95_SYMPI|nr:rlmJ [Symbiodinium pilosum]
MPFAIACVVLLAAEAAALAETQPPMTRPTSGQLDHFSYSMYLDDKTEDSRRLHLPHLPHLRGPPVSVLQKAAKAAPLVAAALTEIPAVREQLSHRLGRDVPPASDVAKDILQLAGTEARRLGNNLEQSVRQTLQTVKREAHGAVEEAHVVVQELNETVSTAERKAEELIHHKPKAAPHRSHSWLVGTLGFAALLGVAASRRWAARRRPAMAGTRRRVRRWGRAPPVIPSRESVLQRTPSQSSLTPVKVHKVEFQRVGVNDGAEWDSPDENDADESPQDYRRQPSFGKTTPRTEYYQIGGQQDVAEGCACFRFDITCHWLWNRTPPVRPREGKTVPWVLENFDAVQHPKL